MKIDVSTVAVPRKGKPISEDTFGIIHEQGLPFFAAIVDGHGPGDACNQETAEFSAFVLNELMTRFRASPSTEQLPQIFNETQKRVEARYEDLPFGAVATCLVIDEYGLTIAQAGDCRVYQFLTTSRSGYAMLTQDHCVENVTEMVRLRPFYDSGKFRPIDHNVGGHWMYVCEMRLHSKMSNGNWSANGLMPTRGFGDPDFRPAFTHEPEIRFIPTDRREPTLFALTSDGGSRTVEDVFKSMRQKYIKDIPHVVEKVKASIPEHPRDDLTIILISLSPTP